MTGFLITSSAGAPFRGPDTPGAIIALLFGMTAMGVQSALVRLLMRSVASTNVMTTNTTRLAISTTEMLLAGFERRKAEGRNLTPDFAQARKEFAVLLPIGLGFFAGTAFGAIAYINLGLACVVLAIFPVGGLALWQSRHS